MLEMNVKEVKPPKIYQVMPYNVNQLCENIENSESTKGIPVYQSPTTSNSYQNHSEYLERSIEIVGKDKRRKDKMPIEPLDLNLNTRSAERCIGKRKSASLYCYTCCKNENSATHCKVSNTQWSSSMFLFLLIGVGVPPGCCFLPFCIPSCYRYEHYCSNCGTYLGSSKCEESTS